MKPIPRAALLWSACLAMALGGCGNKGDLVRPGASPEAGPDAGETPAVPEAVPPADGRPATDPD